MGISFSKVVNVGADCICPGRMQCAYSIGITELGINE